MFQFYDSPIKSVLTLQGRINPYVRFNSMIVRLKASEPFTGVKPAP